MLKTVRSRRPTWMIPFLLIVAGCSSSDDRLIELGQQSCDRQAQQNDTIATQAKQVTETTRQFVEAEGQARQEILEIQSELVDRDAQCRQELNTLQRETQAAVEAGRQNLDRQREELEAERRQIATERQRAPVIAAAIQQVGLWLACLLPLVLCGYLLYVLRHSSHDDAAVTELLVEELTTDRPRFLLRGPPATADQLVLPTTEAKPDPGIAESRPD